MCTGFSPPTKSPSEIIQPKLGVGYLEQGSPMTNKFLAESV